MRSHQVCTALFALLLTVVLCACSGYQIALVTVTPEGGAGSQPTASLENTAIQPEPTSSEPAAYPVEAATLAPTLTDVLSVEPTEPAAPTAAPIETPLPSATSAPAHTAAPVATNTLVPAETPLPAPVRVTFAEGETSLVLSGHIPAHGMVRYALRASARQFLMVAVESGAAVGLHIQGATGEVLKDNDGVSIYRGTVPVTQDYYVALSAGASAADYTMQIIIPVRIAFARGTTAGSVDGSLPANSHNYYILGVQANQLMNVDLSAETGVKLSIAGLDGTVMLSGMGDSTSFRGLLPITQEYLITVSTAGSARSYSLNVQIPERVQFVQGAIAAVREGTLGAFQQHAYVVKAAAGQSMQVRVTAPADLLRLTIWGLDGTVLMSGMGGGYEFTGSLPFTEDYVISVSAGATGTTFTLDIMIE